MPRKSNRVPGIEKRGDKWRARAFHSGMEKTKTFATQDEAMRWKREIERALERGEWIDPSLSSITFADWAKMWLSAKNNISVSTKRGYETRLRSHLLPAFGRHKLTAITNNEIGQWVAKGIKAGEGAVVIKQSYGVMRQIMGAAVLDGRLNRNPVLGVKLPRTKSKEKQALSMPQLRRLAEECGEYETLILFAGTTGLRWGELIALEGRDVNVLHKTVSVSKAYSEGENYELVLGGTKTHQNRVVPFPKEIVGEVSALIEKGNASAPLFRMPGGGVMNYRNFMGRVFKPAALRAELPEVSFHALRHTTASLLISAGTPITTVAGILGHASTQMTLDVYGHLYEDDATKYIDRLGESLFDIRTDKERPNPLQDIGISTK